MYYLHYVDRILFRLACLCLLICAIVTGNIAFWLFFLFTMYKWSEVFRKYYKKGTKLKYFKIDNCKLSFYTNDTKHYSINYDSINKIKIYENPKIAYEHDSYTLELKLNNSSEIFKVELTDITSLSLFYDYFHNIIPIDLFGSDKFKKRILKRKEDELVVFTIVIIMITLGIILAIIF